MPISNCIIFQKQEKRHQGWWQNLLWRQETPSPQPKPWWLVHQSWGFCISQHFQLWHKVSQDCHSCAASMISNSPSFNATWALILYINSMSYAWVKTHNFPPTGFLSLIMQFFRMMPCYLSSGPSFHRGSCWGGARPQHSYNVQSSWTPPLPQMPKWLTSPIMTSAL